MDVVTELVKKNFAKPALAHEWEAEPQTSFPSSQRVIYEDLNPCGLVVPTRVIQPPGIEHSNFALS